MSFSDLISGDENQESQGFGCTDYQAEWYDANCASLRFHTGIDIGANCGDEVYASRAGSVVAIGIVFLGASAVAIQGDDGIFLEYGHLNDAVVSVGQRVEQGQLIGHVGTKGQSSGCHLHLEARTDGPYQSLDNLVDPSVYINQGSDDMNAADEQMLQAIHQTSQGGLLPLLPALGELPAKVDALVAKVDALSQGGTGQIDYTELAKALIAQVQGH